MTCDGQSAVGGLPGPPTLRLLGPLGVVLDGAEHRVTGHAGVVLGALGDACPGWVDRSALAELLWPDGPPASAASALRTYVSKARRLVEGAGLRLESAGQSLRIAGDVDRVDCVRFETVATAILEVAEHESVEDVGRAGAVAEQIADLVALWPAHGLDPLPGQALLTTRQLGLEQLHARLSDRRAVALIAAERSPEAIPLLEQLLEGDPFHEHRWILLARALQQAGRNVDALAAVRRAMTLLREELGLEPGSDLRHAELAILRTDPATKGTTADIVAMAALDPGGVALPILARASGLSPERALDALRDEIAAGTIEEVRGTPPRFRATTPVSATSGAAAVIEQSRALFDALEAAQVTASERLRHALAAADVLGAAVGPTLVDACHELIAAGEYEQVVDLGRWLDHGAPVSAADRRGVDAAVQFAEAATGRSTHADSALLDLAADAATAADWPNVVRALRLRAELGHAFTIDEHEDELLRSALDAVADDQLTLRFDLLELRFFSLLHAGASATDLNDLWQQAADHANALDVPDRRARASHMEHQLASLRGDYGPSVTALSQRTRRFARAARDHTLEAKAVADLLADAIATHDLVAAGNYAAELGDGPDPHGRWVGLLWSAALHLDDLELELAVLAGQQATRLGIRHGIVAAADATVAQQVVLMWVEGRLDELSPLLDADDWRLPGRAVWGAVLALALHGSGDANRAAEVAEEVSRFVAATGADGWAEPVTHACLAEVAAACGLAGVADRSTEYLDRRAGGRVAVGSVDFGPVDRYRGLLARASGDVATARTLLLRSARQAGCPLWETRTAADLAALADNGTHVALDVDGQHR